MKYKLNQSLRIKEGMNPAGVQRSIVEGPNDGAVVEYLMANKLLVIRTIPNHDNYGNIYNFDTPRGNVWMKEMALRSLKKAVVTKDLTEVEWLDRVQANFREDII